MTHAISKQVGHRLKALRESRGLTQAQLAQLSLKSIETISNFERGKVVPGLVALEKMAAVLRCQVRDFFDDVGEVSSADAPRSEAAQKVLNSVDLLPEEDIQVIASLVDALAKRAAR